MVQQQLYSLANNASFYLKKNVQSNRRGLQVVERLNE